MNRVVITGIGTISSLGNNLSSLINNLEQDACGIKYMPEWEEYKGLNSRVAAPAKCENIKKIPRRCRRSMGRISILAAQAAEEAVSDAGLYKEEIESEETGCIIGSTMGSAEALHEAFNLIVPEKDLNNVSSMQFFKSVSHTAAMNVSQYLNLQGTVMATSAACASSLQAIGTGVDLIKNGTQEIVLCGGSEEVGPTVTGSFDILFATSTKYNSTPEVSSRPFDKDRDGLVCGEGSGILVLENYESAKKRGAKIYGEVVGYYSCGSGAHISQSDEESINRCLRKTLNISNLKPEQIDYISAHATSTIHGDREEVKAINTIFGSDVPISSLKGNLGHTLGASGAIELGAALIMMKKQVIYPTLNLDCVSSDCEGVRHIFKPLKKPINYFLKNCFAFGGINASLIVKNI